MLYNTNGNRNKLYALAYHPIYNQKTVCSDVGEVFIRKKIAEDGDCGFTAFGITRQHAIDLLLENIINNKQVVRLLQQPLMEVMFQEKFSEYIAQHKMFLHYTKIFTQLIEAETSCDFINSNKLRAKLKQYISDANFLSCYINYDVRDRQVDGGWAHPAVLQALAEIRGLRLNIFTVNEQCLIPHEFYPIYNEHAEQEINLLFINGNHFESLERLNNKKKLNEIEEISNFNASEKRPELLFAFESSASITSSCVTLTSKLKAELFFHRFTKGEIIYVYGTSTAGKSTFTQELSNILSDAFLVSTRYLKTLYMEKIVREICPQEYDYVSKFLSIDEIFFFLDDPKLFSSPIDVNILTELEKIKTKTGLINARYNPTEQLHYVYNHVFMLSNHNKTVIFDNLDVLNFLYYISLHNIHSPIHMLLLYCPPSKLLDRVEKRNSRAMIMDKADMRSIMRPLQTFINIYKHSEDGAFIKRIRNDNLIEIYHIAHVKSRETNDKNILSKLQWEEVLDTLISNFGDRSIVNLQSKYPYDLLLDTGKYSPQTLVKFVYEKSIRPRFL